MRTVKRALLAASFVLAMLGAGCANVPAGVEEDGLGPHAAVEQRTLLTELQQNLRTVDPDIVEIEGRLRDVDGNLRLQKEPGEH